MQLKLFSAQSSLELTMSFEGYQRVLCKSGHLHVWDVYDCPSMTDWQCHCGEGVAWSQIVDETNGTHDDEGNRIDGFVYLEEISEPESCPTCNRPFDYTRRYKIPEESD